MTQAGLAPSTVRQAHRVFSLLLALAVRDGRLTRNVAAGVRLPRVGRADKVFLTHAQVDELAAAAEPHGLIVRVLAYTGLRWGELAALRVRRVDLVKRRLLVAGVGDRGQRSGGVRYAEDASTPVGVDPPVPGRADRHADRRP
ncbi:tyrosine-type recombinase/integrase [Micromonospora chersina]